MRGVSIAENASRKTSPALIRTANPSFRLSGIVGMQAVLYFRMFNRDLTSTKVKVGISLCSWLEMNNVNDLPV